jgi:hypothetical protein
LEASLIRIVGVHALQGREPESGGCSAHPSIPPGVAETVVVGSDERRITLRGAGGKLDPACGATSSAAAVLFEIVDEVMRNYYPRPL